MARKLSFPKEKITTLLLEGVHPAAAERFAESGYNAKIESSALSRDRLRGAIRGVHMLGIRSKTQVTAEILKAAEHLLAIGCFCIGTDQVALDAAARRGIPVFNAPFSSTRSVAELTMAEVVMLARKVGHRSMQLHAGRWEKSSSDCHEVRNKTIGIVGYGHVGQQVGLLAEGFGMRVVFYDIARKLPLGNALSCSSLVELLGLADFVTLHVPETPLTIGMIGEAELERIRTGGYLLNLSRGSVVDLSALRRAVLSGHLAGAAVDVFPGEPKTGSERFEVELSGLDNVVLTPHVGGSTVEAQKSIGVEVASALIEFTDSGSTTGAVNFPEVELPMVGESHRVLDIHRNVPGVLRDINRIVADRGANVRSQYLKTRGEIGYLIMDVDPTLSRQVKRDIEALDANIRTRLLF